MSSKALILAGIIAYVEARFGQEQIPVSNIQALDNFGDPGVAATLAGAVPGVLLAGASACDKLSLADDIVAQLGDDQAVIDAALSLVAAEQNFNDFADATGRICSDPTLPATEALRGVIPLFDPQVAGSDVQNANSAQSLANPLDANGLSVADLSRAQGFSNFNDQDADGNISETATGGGAAAADAANDTGDEGNAADEDAADDNADNANADNANDDNANDDNANDDNANDTADDTADDNTDDNANDDNANDGTNDTADDNADDAEATELQSLTTQFQAINVDADADFGNCDLTIQQLANTEFAGRANDDGLFFFQSSDATIADRQQEALNGEIIMKRVCDDLVNVCGGNTAARDACDEVQTLVSDSAIDKKSPVLADAFNAGIDAITA